MLSDRSDPGRPSRSGAVGISVLIVDDSTVVRRLVAAALDEDPEVTVVGSAANGELALAKLDLLDPDVVTLDLEMPVMDGLTTLRELRRRRPDLPVIMFSTLTERGAVATLEALALGASDYVTKPAGAGSVLASLQAVREQLLPRVKELHAARRPAGRGRHPVRPAPPTRRPASTPPRRPGPTHPVEVLAIGCSTGGPEALARILPSLPADLPVPVVVVQHMPPLFTRMLAARLDGLGPCPVIEADHGTALEPGTVYLAPGGRHLELARVGAHVRTVLTDEPPQNYCRPAVDVLFGSVAEAYGAGALALVLTGMGRDGARGAQLLRAAGARIVAQDQASSVVWGMPGAVVTAGLVDEVVPLGGMADVVRRALARPVGSTSLSGAAR